MINKSITEIAVEDFLNLITNEIPESKTLEYKKILTLKTDSDKKEFLNDISAFANTMGGDLIYGIGENDKKLPNEIINIEFGNVDEIKLQIDSLIRDGIEPRINEVQIKEFKPEEKTILLIRIPKSWNSPHQVTFKGSSKFYARANNGKYQMDINDLRSAFLLSDTITQKIKQFVSDRIMQISSGNGPIPLNEFGKIVLHLLPISSFGVPVQDVLKYKSIVTKLRPLNGGSRTPRYNIDGVITHSSTKTRKGYDSYAQLFRNGIIETTNSELLYPYIENNFVIPVSDSLNYEYYIIESLREYLDIYKKLDIGLPILIYVSLIDIKGYKLFPKNFRSSFTSPTAIDKNVIVLPEVIINNLNDNLPLIVKPIFDIIWNACGWERSLNYDDRGNWIWEK